MKIDLHVHTNVSPCSNISLSDAVKIAIKNNVKAIAVCNHNKPMFFEDVQELSYELNKELDIQINPEKRTDNEFYIIPGVEFSSEYGHIIGLFLQKCDFKDNDDIFSFIKNCNGIIGIAHPFQKTNDYKKRSSELLKISDKIDFVETHSSRANYKNKKANSMAKLFAKENNLYITAGSDAHFVCEIGNSFMEIPDNFDGINGIKHAILDGKNSFHSQNSKRTFIAESQIIKNKKNNKVSIKTYLFYLYCLIRDLGDKICQK